MGQVVRELYSPSKQYKVEIIKRKDGLYTTEVYRWRIVDMSFGALCRKGCL